MRWLRYVVGLLIALTLHSLLDNFFPNALAFFSPYVILVVYYSMGGNLFGAIVAGVIAGLVQDAFSGAIFGLHAFSLTVCAYLVAYINSRLVLRGPIAFGGALIGSVILNDPLQASYSWADFLYVGGDAVAILPWDRPLQIVHSPLVGAQP